ncbi:MAG: UDP-glucose/GDP-mannose dehydrogenase family protein [Anaerolineales bacterium]
MRLSVFGLGYVGCVSAACLARDGHTVIGVDVSQPKLDLLAAGLAPVSEPGLAELLGAAVAAGRLRVTRDAAAAVRASELSLICVGTPSGPDGSLDLQFVESVCREIGAALAAAEAYHVVVVRSTVLPGTTAEKLVPLLEAGSGRRAGPDFGVCINPEFLREGSAIVDYDHPGLIVIGALDARAAGLAERLYSAAGAPVARTTLAAAEMVKYASNALHALKVAFANEIGSLSQAQGVDGQEVMELVCRDTRLNISSAYLKPGFAFGGSCLPKDTRALLRRAQALAVDTPLLRAVLDSNQRQIERGLALIENTGRRRVGILGLSFKPDTDDVRESPAIPLIQALLARGYQVWVYDGNVEPYRLIGANRAYLERELPGIAALIRPSIAAVVAEAEVVVITYASAAFQAALPLLCAGQILVDLAGMGRAAEQKAGEYASLG